MGLLGGDGVDRLRGDFVTEDRIDHVADALADDETVLFLARGSGVDVDGSADHGLGEGRRRSHVWTVATTDAAAVVPQHDAHAGVHLPYGSLADVTLAVGQTPRISLSSGDVTVRVDADLPEERELVTMVGYLCGRARAARVGDPEPLDLVATLTYLNDHGVINDADYIARRRDVFGRR